MVAKKIEAMKDNKSNGVDGILTKPLMQTVEHISTLLSRVFNFNTTVFNIKRGSGLNFLVDTN